MGSDLGSDLGSGQVDKDMIVIKLALRSMWQARLVVVLCLGQAAGFSRAATGFFPGSSWAAC